MVEAIRACGGRAVFVPTDVTLESDVAGLVGVALAEFGRLDGAFNNAGGAQAVGPLQDLDDAAWQAELDLNLSSVFYGLKHQIPAIVTAGGGAIVNTSSTFGTVGTSTLAGYVAAKHGVIGLTRAAALETAEQGVRVNALVLGGVDTPLFRSISSMGASPEGKAWIVGLHPVKRMSKPEEIAPFVAFLLSDESTFITGAALAIDGGLTAQ